MGTGLITGVSLGPGDPELITLKGLKALQEADIIYYPGSVFSDGKKDSYALSILKHYDLSVEKMQGFYLKMDLNRASAESTYEGVYNEIKKRYSQGKNIVVVTEGDAGTYSSFSYLLRRFKHDEMSVNVIPGVTSFIAAAARHTVPLSLQSDKIFIAARIADEEQLKECFENYDTIVLMKIRSVIDNIYNVLSRTNYQIYYVERLGTDREFLSTDLKEIKNREIPYFSLMIIKK